jgi:hypothetical protein
MGWLDTWDERNRKVSERQQHVLQEAEGREAPVSDPEGRTWHVSPKTSKEHVLGPAILPFPLDALVYEVHARLRGSVIIEARRDDGLVHHTRVRHPREAVTAVYEVRRRLSQGHLPPSKL